MKFYIYGLRIARTKQVLSIGHTHQRLQERLSKHIQRSKELYHRVSEYKRSRADALTDLLLNGGDAGISYGRYSDKAFIIVTLLTRGETIEIFPTEEIEVDAPGSRIPEEVHWKETLWKARYFLQQNRPMLIDGKLLRKYALQ